MEDSQNINNKLLVRLETLLEKQSLLQQELLKLKADIQSYNLDQPEGVAPSHSQIPEVPIYVEDKSLSPINELQDAVEPNINSLPNINRKVPYDDAKPYEQMAYTETPYAAASVHSKSNLEKFIGENLINKIGIAITIVGVGIGAKYSIENELISPFTRIVLGYLFGLGLIGFALWLKVKYENFSAVLLSGGMATFYLITYAAYDFYGIFPQVFAFALMVLFTAFTVVAAIHYNRQVIAHIGLVGAYAVPFLLSEGEGKVAILFSYMAIINIGILLIAIKRYWKSLYYSAFIITWLIFTSWFFTRYEAAVHFKIAAVFMVVFFVIFYGTFLSYKILRKEQFNLGDVAILLLNSFVFYGLSYSMLSLHQDGEQLLGLFTLVNALVHFGVCSLIYRKNLADKNLFYLLAGLVLVFITIAVPVQLDGNWVTLLWAGQALLLFWIGRRKQVTLYEMLSYPLIVLAFISILHDWSWHDTYSYSTTVQDRMNVIFNPHFFTAIIFISMFSYLQYINMKHSYTSSWSIRESLLPFYNILIPSILLIVSYFAFRLEIERFWDNRFIASSVVSIPDNDDGYQNTFNDYTYITLKNIWVINYSLLFLAIASWGNIIKIKNLLFTRVLIVLNVLAVVVFLVSALLLFSELRDNYLNQYLSEYYERDSAYLSLRYLSILFFGVFLYTFYKLIQQEGLKERNYLLFDYLLHVSILWILSSEMINLLELMGSSQSYKLGLSILWGIYSLFMIVLGIWKKKKHLRMAAIILFSITLLKLFTYDISHLDTIAKTIVFVSLGILLLIISFLYNKYKSAISDEA
ncbi:MAG: DUF2339 domain-containing protein [Bacteroidota bacterium]|nr:DUF2339 domain-containing protein [Bacteroidota bacterium]